MELYTDTENCETVYVLRPCMLCSLLFADKFADEFANEFASELVAKFFPIII